MPESNVSRRNFMVSLRAALRFSCFASVVLISWADSRAQAASVPAAFRADSQLVLVPVTVTDRDGKTIQGLRAQDFDIRDDQTPQRIVSFSSEDAPSSVGIVLDISGSMRNTLGVAKNIAALFLRTANPLDEFMLLTVSSHADAGPRFATDIAELEESIQSAGPGGMTALIDTVHLGLNRMRKASSRSRCPGLHDPRSQWTRRRRSGHTFPPQHDRQAG
jgi:Ca-activated chloride channel family protein